MAMIRSNYGQQFLFQYVYWARKKSKWKKTLHLYAARGNDTLSAPMETPLYQSNHRYTRHLTMSMYLKRKPKKYWMNRNATPRTLFMVGSSGFSVWL